jgi:hypothetical protein
MKYMSTQEHAFKPRQRFLLELGGGTWFLVGHLYWKSHGAVEKLEKYWFKGDHEGPVGEGQVGATSAGCWVRVVARPVQLCEPELQVYGGDKG